VTLKKWLIGNPDRQMAKSLAEECDIDPFVALIACGRGYETPDEIEQFISEEPDFTDPRELADIEKAAEFINGYISENRKIAVFGDYDCDGVTSTALMYDYLKSRGADVITYIPDRVAEGYGMNIGAVDKLKSLGVELIITVDNGISCKEEIAYADSIGIKTVVTDHHLPPEEIPNAVAVVDPHRVDCPSTFKEICGVEVAFKVVCVMDNKEPEELIYRYADLLAVGTVGDVMPLIYENRSIVRTGVEMIKRNARVGISALLSIAGIEKSSVTASKIAFGIVPRINAAGRMGSAERALELLKCENMLEALNIVEIIDEANVERQSVEKRILSEAIEKIEKNGYKYNRVIVVAGEDWNLGVVGIVASRISEKYGKPAFVIGIEGDTAHGSGRSQGGFSLYDAMSSCENTLTKFGGHALAGGISLNTDKIDDFREAVNLYAQKFEYCPPELNLDCRINPAGMTVDLVDAVKLLEPFGAGNRQPIFGIFEVKLERITPIGNGKHLKLLFYKGNNAFQALLFGVTPQQFCFEVGDILDLAVILEGNYYKDNYTLSVQIKSLRISGLDYDSVFDDLSSYHDYRSGLDYNCKKILPSREQVGILYKEICKAPVLRDRIEYIYLNELGYAKTQLAITTLCELGLINEEKGILSAVKGAPRTELTNSPTYKKIYEEGKQ